MQNIVLEIPRETEGTESVQEQIYQRGVKTVRDGFTQRHPSLGNRMLFQQNDEVLLFSKPCQDFAQR